MARSPYDLTDRPKTDADAAVDRLAIACIAYAYCRRLETGEPDRVIGLALQSDFASLAVAQDAAVQALLGDPKNSFRKLLGIRPPQAIPRP